ncbi:hypothetical protein D8O27_25925 [Burkholderia mallei]|uniref:Uncharacterized protein n=2 Tax=Burkholderia mallei TaxID=13373 RepID=A2RXT6_BURM9|nr:hypothetical protein BMA10229_0690 [Burkholderia mallei NCTC 10229]ABO02254.1 hypothetical protein BMA10247_A1643 [Burkholderia mallei NCTC 10247]EEP84035.1 conserved hypothetical protein [Burkholderia mallei GB8 horse 4]RKN98433.1 hypothetical protein D8O31_12355 [Burkholderia mallei]RKO02074.1 hypothetical protein D8O05_18345 [Burkholderia mallei]
MGARRAAWARMRAAAGCRAGRPRTRRRRRARCGDGGRAIDGGNLSREMGCDDRSERRWQPIGCGGGRRVRLSADPRSRGDEMRAADRRRWAADDTRHARPVARRPMRDGASMFGCESTAGPRPAVGGRLPAVGFARPVTAGRWRTARVGWPVSDGRRWTNRRGATAREARRTAGDRRPARTARAVLQ